MNMMDEEDVDLQENNVYKFSVGDEGVRQDYYTSEPEKEDYLGQFYGSVSGM